MVVLSSAFAGFIFFNHTHSTLHGERAPFVTHPNELIFREAIANRNLENGFSFERQKDRPYQVRFPPFCVLVYE